MSDDTKKPAMLTAAISMLGLSLGVSAPADAQFGPPLPGAQPGNQGVLIGLNQPSSEQLKSEQFKSEQYKSEQLKSQQLKSQQLKSQQLKSNQVKLAPQP
jgi:hypothetical protein